MKKIGWIGTGNMARAILQGILKRSSNYTMRAYSPHLALKTDFPSIVCANAKEVAQDCDLLFLAVKPYKMKEVLEEIQGVIQPHTIVITIAVSLTIAWYENLLGSSVHFVRTLPNTCSFVQEGFTAVTMNQNITKEEKEEVITLFNMIGVVEEIEEHQMNAVSALTGSTPALVYMVIEAMADVAVKNGIARPLAYNMAAQAVKGAGAMVLDSHLHPGILKDQVCSPAGSTIVGVAKAEQLGLRSTMMEAIDAMIQRTNQIKA